ncbi:MAG: putative C-S lyase [Hydrogenophilales bacterium]|nr:putative C-S lyase [Hydrogenophilales bacterium]
MSIDFGRVIERNGTASVKWDGRGAHFGTTEVTPLWVADMDFAAPEAVTQALIERARHPVYGYTLDPDSAYDVLIGWLQRRHGWRIERDWIVMAPGVVPSLYAAVHTFTQPGDGVIVQPPVYFPFFSAVTTPGRRLLENPLRLDGERYGIDFAHLERRAAEGARLMLLCSPHNPVGRVWTVAELRELLRIARRHDIVILSDEIHHDLIYPGERHHPLATLAEGGDRIITAVAPSKTFNIPGLGLSALIVPDAGHRQRLHQSFDLLHAGNYNPFSIVAFEAGYRNGDAWLDALMTYLAQTRAAVGAFIASKLPGIRVIPAQGTYLLWLDCRGMGLDDATLMACFIQAGAGLSPGTVFGTGGSGFMRLNIGAPKAVILAALDRLVATLAG